MENYVKKIIEQLSKDNINLINFLISIGVIDLTKFIDEVIKSNNPETACLTAIYLENAPISKLVHGIVNMDISKNIEDRRWECLINITRNVSNAPLDEIIDILISKSKQYNKAAKVLRFLLPYSPEPNKIISAIIATQNAQIIMNALQYLNFDNESLINGILNCLEMENQNIDIYKLITQIDIRYISRIIMCIQKTTETQFLKILLLPECLLKIEQTLDLEIASNNYEYLKFLVSYLESESNKIKNLPEVYEYLMFGTGYNKYYFGMYKAKNSVPIQKDILEIIKRIIKKIKNSRAYISSLEKDELYGFMIKAYNNGNLEVIIENKDVFKELFNDVDFARKRCNDKK